MPLALRTQSIAMDKMPSVLKEEDAADLLGIEAKKLRRLVYDRKGPKTIKLGRDRLYPRDAFFEWIASRAR